MLPLSHVALLGRKLPSLTVIAVAGVVAALLGMLSALGLGSARLQASGIEPATAPAAHQMAIGTNLDGLAYFSSAMPMLDLMKSSDPWLTQAPGQWDTKEPLNLDELGWVRRLPGSSEATARTLGLIVMRENGAASPPKARYVVLYEGEGAFEGLVGTKVVNSRPGRLLIQAGDDGWVHLQITKTDPRNFGNYLRNIRIVPEDRLAAYQDGEIFNPVWLNKIQGFRALRFMDWMATNNLFRANGSKVNLSNPGEGALSAGQLNWADRPQMADAFWNRGVPVEAMVKLANQTGAEPWFNMPINASDDYVRGFASYVRDHLDKSRRIHVELSNEVWNWSFPQAHYANARAGQERGADADRMEWYGKRAAEVGAIWNQVFGEPVSGGEPGRVRIVYNTQFAYKGLEALGLETARWKDAEGRHRRAADVFNEYAITGYYGAGLGEDSNAQKVMGWWNLPDGGFQKALAALRDGIDHTNAPLYQYHGERARKYGLDLVTYESGFGERTPISQHANDRYTNFLIALQRRPEIYDLELRNAEAFRRAGGILFMNFGLIGKPGKWGSWSALESLEQETSPRYRALRELLRRNPRPSEAKQ